MIIHTHRIGLQDVGCIIGDHMSTEQQDLELLDIAKAYGFEVGDNETRFSAELSTEEREYYALAAEDALLWLNTHACEREVSLQWREGSLCVVDDTQDDDEL